jgi:hypothetical protein
LNNFIVLVRFKSPKTWNSGEPAEAIPSPPSSLTPVQSSMKLSKLSVVLALLLYLILQLPHSTRRFGVVGTAKHVFLGSSFLPEILRFLDSGLVSQNICCVYASLANVNLLYD